MLSKSITRAAAVAILAAFAASAAAQQAATPPPPPPSYGAPISIDNAKKAAAAGVAEARKNNWAMAIAVTDPAGMLVYFEKMDGTQNGSVKVAINKARSAALFRRPTKVWEDIVAGGGGLRIFSLEGAVALEGGTPVMVDCKVVGAIGVSGGSGQQDGAVANAGAGALKK